MSIKVSRVTLATCLLCHVLDCAAAAAAPGRAGQLNFRLDFNNKKATRAAAMNFKLFINGTSCVCVLGCVCVRVCVISVL